VCASSDSCLCSSVYVLVLCVSDELVRQSCGSVIHAINQQSPDVLQKHLSLVLPLVFFATHQISGRIYRDVELML